MSYTNRVIRSGTVFKMEEIARWQALGHSVDQIARVMNMTPDAVSRLVAHSDYRPIQEKVTAKVYGHVDQTIAQRKANVMLEEAAPDAAVALIALLEEGLPGDKRQAATAILDRAGYGPIQKRAVRQRIEFDPMTMSILRLALLETSETVDAEVLDDDDDDDFPDALPG